MAPLTNLGFLTVIHDSAGYFGGYLVTNAWGRPLEFRLTTTVQPNRIQEVLYGPTLRTYLYAELIGKTLVEKTAVSVEAIVTDSEPLLDLRLHWEKPVAWLAKPDDALARSLQESGAGTVSTAAGPLLVHPRHAGDARRLGEVLRHLDAGADLAEPFHRIQEALAEARKMGATRRG